jgi:mono/diheme cytochrome c family protein
MGDSMMFVRPGRVLATIVIAGVCAIAPRVFAQEPAAKDYNQRSLEIFEFRKAAKSGPERGREIFYYKCWFCHNEFTKDIPKLEGLFTRTNLLSGVPVNEANVKDKVRNGGPGMPSYRSVLNDTDLNDLTSYLREGCCWNSDSPPSNPRYIAR